MVFFVVETFNKNIWEKVLTVVWGYCCPCIKQLTNLFRFNVTSVSSLDLLYLKNGEPTLSLIITLGL